jgi:hypothetical protein
MFIVTGSRTALIRFYQASRPPREGGVTMRLTLSNGRRRAPIASHVGVCYNLVAREAREAAGSGPPAQLSHRR